MNDRVETLPWLQVLGRARRVPNQGLFPRRRGDAQQTSDLVAACRQERNQRRADQSMRAGNKYAFGLAIGAHALAGQIGAEGAMPISEGPRELAMHEIAAQQSAQRP